MQFKYICSDYTEFSQQEKKTEMYQKKKKKKLITIYLIDLFLSKHPLPFFCKHETLGCNFDICC